MKRFISALFVYIQIGLGCGLALLAIANAAYISCNNPTGDESWNVVIFSLIGLPLLFAGIAKLERRRSPQPPTNPT